MTSLERQLTGMCLLMSPLPARCPGAQWVSADDHSARHTLLEAISLEEWMLQGNLYACQIFSNSLLWPLLSGLTFKAQWLVSCGVPEI